jgi:hypothetical protein
MPSVFFFDEPVDVSQLGSWQRAAGNFSVAIGHTAWGDFFLQNPDTGQIAVLYVFDPEIVPLSFNSQASLAAEFVPAPAAQQHLIRPDKVLELERRIGPLRPGEVFIPEPYPFLGGSCDPDTYVKGNVWVFIDLVGQLQGVDVET